MKKITIVAAALVAVMAALVMFGCQSDSEQSKFEEFKKTYETIAEANVIEAKIEIKGGDLTKYTLEKKLTKTESGYSVTESEKRRVEIGTEGADENGFKLTETTYNVTKEEEPTMNIRFEKDDFAEYELTESGLKASVKDENAKAMLGLGDDTAEIKNLRIEIKVKDLKVSEVVVSYVSDGSDSVKEVITFSYAEN